MAKKGSRVVKMLLEEGREGGAKLNEGMTAHRRGSAIEGALDLNLESEIKHLKAEMRNSLRSEVKQKRRKEFQFAGSAVFRLFQSDSTTYSISLTKLRLPVSP